VRRSTPSPEADPGPGTGGPDEQRVDILVVDDLPEKLLVFRTVLDEIGQNVVCVRSGREALREVLQREFAVILLDVNMPDVDGFETAALIRQHKRSAQTPIIFITSYADEMQTERGYALGAVDYILSPVVPAVLRSKVQVFVELYATQRQIRRQSDAQAAFVAAEAARRVAEENDRRSAFLLDASRVLHRTLEVDAGVRGLLGLIVPGWASFAAVLRADAGATAPLTTARRSAAVGVLMAAAEPQGLHPAVLDALRAALAEGRRIDLGAEARSAVDAWLAGASAVSAAPPPLDAAAAVPLRSGDRLLGAVFVASREHDAQDAAIGWPVLEELAGRAAAALENARLYSSLQAEIVERRAVEAQLIEAGQRKDEFLAMLSHELRNPLAPICTALEVIRRIGAPDPKFTWAADVMGRQLHQLTRLIEELLDVARISQGKIVLSREKVDLNAVIRAGVETVQPFIDARQQTLEVTQLTESKWLHGDFARLTQIVANLLNNASKYSEPRTRIELRADADERGVAVRVRDQGMGIDPELLPRVFDLFTQGRRGLDRTQGGLGIGLTLARRLAELHGGTIEARSPGVGKGAQFTVYLPCIGVIRTAEPIPPPAPRRSMRSLRVLVVDDNLDAAESVGRYFELEGHEVKLAGDGLEALDVASAYLPEVVVLDIGLPALDGYEVARRLRQRPATRHAFLVALTGYGQRDDRQRADSAGFDRHFVKPADPQALLSAVHVWLGEADERHG
jgi:CheY-like chemotaxis protein/signal transduction histidine kinase